MRWRQRDGESRANERRRSTNAQAPEREYPLRKAISWRLATGDWRLASLRLSACILSQGWPGTVCIRKLTAESRSCRVHLVLATM
jgi:hypothetical protein